MAALQACQSTPAPPAAAPATLGPPPQAVETFDVVWTTIDEHHFDKSHNGVDWIAVREEFRPKVATVRTDEELRELLEAMIARLGQSHFGIIPREVSSPDAAAASSAGTSSSSTVDAPASARVVGPEDDGPPGDLGVSFRLVEGAIVTVAPRPDGPAARAGIEAGWTLLAVNGAAVTPPPIAPADATSTMVRYVAESTAAHRVRIGAGRSATLAFDTPIGRREIELTAVTSGGEFAKFGNLPPLETVVSDRTISTAELQRAAVTGQVPAIGYIAFNIWMIPAAARIDLAVDRHRDAGGLILDLRGNPGGIGAMAMGIGGHFLSEPVSLGKMITPETTLDFRVNPRRVTADGRIVQPFAGPLAILVDPMTASTSEIFAAGLQELGRARVFGETTAGAALPSIAVKLPNGDVLQYAMADFVTPNGNRIEGHGVMPDTPIVLTGEELRRDPDPVLTAAVRWIADEVARIDAARGAPTG